LDPYLLELLDPDPYAWVPTHWSWWIRIPMLDPYPLELLDPDPMLGSLFIGAAGSGSQCMDPYPLELPDPDPVIQIALKVLKKVKLNTLHKF
jgi:hypothetical protein